MAIGEIDAEPIIFLDESESSTGNAGILFAGEFSGTVSWWEFECDGVPVMEAAAEEVESSSAASFFNDKFSLVAFFAVVAMVM